MKRWPKDYHWQKRFVLECAEELLRPLELELRIEFRSQHTFDVYHGPPPFYTFPGTVALVGGRWGLAHDLESQGVPFLRTRAALDLATGHTLEEVRDKIHADPRLLRARALIARELQSFVRAPAKGGQSPRCSTRNANRQGRIRARNARSSQ